MSVRLLEKGRGAGWEAAGATRYDNLARNFLAATTLVGALYWIKL